MKISILTATYNRAEYLQTLYESIVSNQDRSNIAAEWIIINDGSTDETEKLVDRFVLENKVEIKYIYQNNSGKMEAINRGMEVATGDLIVDCDSDDYFSQKAFCTIQKYASKLFNDKELYALCFLKRNKNGILSGNKFKENEKKTTMFDLYFKQGIEGEKILVFNSNVRKKFRHELESNEKFITEARMYHKMDQNYKILCINEVIEIGDYIGDGYTKNLKDTFYNYPNGYYKYFKEIIQKGLKGVKLSKKIYVIKHYIYFWLLIRNKLKINNKNKNLYS